MSLYDLAVTYLLLPSGSFLLYDRASRHAKSLITSPASEINLAIGIVLSVYSILAMLIITLLRLGWGDAMGYCLAFTVIIGGALMLIATYILLPYRLRSAYLSGIFSGRRGIHNSGRSIAGSGRGWSYPDVCVV